MTKKPTYAELEQRVEVLEKALFQSELRLLSAFRAAPVGLAFLKERKFLAVNEAYCEIMGYKESELVGQTTQLLYETENERERVGRALYKGVKMNHFRQGINF